MQVHGEILAGVPNPAVDGAAQGSLSRGWTLSHPQVPSSHHHALIPWVWAQDFGDRGQQAWRQCISPTLALLTLSAPSCASFPHRSFLWCPCSGEPWRELCNNSSRVSTQTWKAKKNQWDFVTQDILEISMGGCQEGNAEKPAIDTLLKIHVPLPNLDLLS